MKLRTGNNSAERAQKTFPEKALYSLERHFSYDSQLALSGLKAETPGLTTFFSCFNLEIIHSYQTAFRDKKFVASLQPALVDCGCKEFCTVQAQIISPSAMVRISLELIIKDAV